MIAEKKTEVNYRVKPVTRLPYPAGIYSASISYTCSANVAPLCRIPAEHIAGCSPVRDEQGLNMAGY